MREATATKLHGDRNEMLKLERRAAEIEQLVAGVKQVMARIEQLAKTLNLAEDRVAVWRH
jgi:hypothetical protein